jgi:hypothetical protein
MNFQVSYKIKFYVSVSSDLYILIADLPTRWSRVHLEKLTSLQLVKKFTAFLWNPKFLYRTHKCPPTVPTLSQLQPVPTTPSNFLEIHLNVIFLFTPRSPQRHLSLWLPHQHPVHTSLLPHTHHMPHPSHSSRFYPPHNIGQGIQIIQLLILYLDSRMGYKTVCTEW